MNIENQMRLLWTKYLETKNFNYLAEACEKASFFGQEEMGKEIGKNFKKFKEWLILNLILVFLVDYFVMATGALMSGVLFVSIFNMAHG